MDEPLPPSPEDMASEHARQIAEARAQASQYLASQGVPGYTPAEPAMSSASESPPVPAGPPRPPAPSKPGIGTHIKNAAINAGATILGGPIAGQMANGVTAYNPGGPPKKTEEGAPAPAELPPAGPPAPPTGEDVPLILANKGAGKVATPAGMYPQSNTVQVHQGRSVPLESKAAFGAATELGLEGAEKQRDADRNYYAQVHNLAATKMRATEDAAAQHAAVQAERDAIVKQRLAQIEATNAEASAEIDPAKYWTNRTAGAKVLGLVSVALGGFADRLLGRENSALKVIQSGINDEINSQLSNRQIAGQKAARQQTLLQLHLDRLGDKDKAIDATKLALYDNVLDQMDAYKAQHGAEGSDAAYLKLKSDILTNRAELVNKMGLQEADDVNKTATETWHNATYAGGGGPGKGNMEGYELIPVPASDQTAEKGAMIAVPKGSHQKLGEIVGSTNAIIGINQDALARIEEINQDMPLVKKGDVEAIKRVQANRKTLEDLGQRKASLISAAEGQGVLKEAEFERAMSDRVIFNDWYKPGVDIKKRIQAQNNGLAGAAGRMVQGVGGQRVQMAYARDKNGALQPNPLFTGKMYVPPPIGPEMRPVKGK